MYATHYESARRNEAFAIREADRVTLVVSGVKPSPGHQVVVERRLGGKDNEFALQWSVEQAYAHIRCAHPYSLRRAVHVPSERDVLVLHHRDGIDVVPILHHEARAPEADTVVEPGEPRRPLMRTEAGAFGAY